MHRKFNNDGVDRIGALQDDVLMYLMSFLPSCDAVRTCVLAKRWHTLWKSVPALRIKDDPVAYRVCECMDETDYDGLEEFDYVGERPTQTRFVDDLLRLRDPTPLNVYICDIRSVFQDLDTCRHDEAFNFRCIKQWIQYALSHKVRVLRVVVTSLTTNMALISSHLKRVELCFMQFEGPLDFSGCQVLDVLQMTGCSIYASILCPSLRHLSITRGFFDYDTRLRISAPNLISLKLEPYRGLAPLLDSMPSLQTASFESLNDNSCEGCSCVVLEGLSSATNLKLTAAHYQVSIVVRVDLKWGPTFGKLKTLLLNKWCVADDFTGLVYFLQHSPILETLMLQLDLRTSEKYHFIKTDESCSPREQSYKSRGQSSLLQHLKVVKIICGRKKDVIVDRILKILCTHGVPYGQIDIE